MLVSNAYRIVVDPGTHAGGEIIKEGREERWALEWNLEVLLKRAGLVIVNSNGLPAISKVGIEPVNGVDVITQSK